MLAPPSAVLAGNPRPYWETAEIPGSPFGPLVSAICPSDPADDVLAPLLPAERAYAASLEAYRRREWLGGRLCLVSALARVTSKRVPILAAASGAPELPRGISGSISHKGPLIVALAASKKGRVGIDVEAVSERDDQLGPKVLTAAETERLRPIAELLAARSVVAHFAIKEAVYKTLDPDEQEDLEFEDVEVAMPEMVTPCTWISAVASVRGSAIVSVAFIFDGDWVMATALRHPNPNPQCAGLDLA